MRALLFALLIALMACGSDSDSTEDNSADGSSTTMTAGENPNLVQNMPWTFLIEGVYHNNATIQAGSSVKDNPNTGHWIDFKENGTFDYGQWDQKMYGGTWFYDGDTELLDINPNDGETRPSQWQIKHKDNNLIWIGTPKYQNNAVQMQWLRRTGYPSK